MAKPCPPSADSVSVIDSCPMNSVEWNQRALLKNCSTYPNCSKQLEYHCLLNPYANESLEVCAPNTWMAEDFCPSYNIKQQRILEQFDCTSLISDCPRSQYFSRSILDYKGCLKELHRSSDTTMKHNDQLMDILVPIIISVLIALIAVIAVVCCWRKRLIRFKGPRQNIEMQLQGLMCCKGPKKDFQLQDKNNGSISESPSSPLLGEPNKETQDDVNIEVEPDQVRQYLSNGELTFYHARGIIVGCGGAGKTTLLKRLMDTPFEQLAEIKSTNIVDVHVNVFSVMDNTIKAIDTGENRPIFQLSRDNITRKEFNYKTYQKEIKINGNAYEDEQTGIEECTPSSYSSHTPRDLTHVTPNYEHNSNEDLASTQSFDRTETAVNTAIKDDKDNKKDGEDNKKDNGDHDSKKDKVYEDSEEDNDDTYDHENKDHDEDDKNDRDHGEHKDHKDNAKVGTNIDIMDAVQKLSREGNEKKTITFLDFAGQSIYYAFHQIYLSPETFSILVIDMEKDPKSKCDPNNSKEEIYCSRFESWTYEDFYRFWLQSIDSFCETDTSVIVVGTHAEGKSKQDCDSFFEKFIALFGDYHLRRHLHKRRCFAISLPENGKMMEELSDLKKAIVKVVENQHYWKRIVKPASAILEHIIQEKKMSRTIHKKELFKLNNTLDSVFRLDDSEITTLLKHLHQAGTLLYFEEPALKDTIILDVQWLVDAFKSILEYYVGIEHANDSIIQKFRETGELDEKDLLNIWKGTQYKKTYKILTSFMERLGLLAKCNNGNQFWYYFPSMNRRKFENKPFEDVKKSSILSFQFEKEKQLPIFVFYKCVVKCMKLSSWEIHIENNCRCIYDDAACFSFRGHIVLLCISNFQIQVQVCRNPANDVDPNILSEIKLMLEKTMEEFRSHNFTFEIGYKCLNGN
uniref:Probable serine/threonine-protein kinase roco6 n=1 Tax=Crassostrea virginica TaxID=6565 RepID=A0A8B8AQ44_CRAVI|nr:probable serine/threonine-protein kinase roco6 [Crassostrea virginica]